MSFMVRNIEIQVCMLVCKNRTIYPVMSIFATIKGIMYVLPTDVQVDGNKQMNESNIM